MTNTTKRDTLQLPYCGPQAQAAFAPLRMWSAMGDVTGIRSIALLDRLVDIDDTCHGRSSVPQSASTPRDAPIGLVDFVLPEDVIAITHLRA
jgi:hypothetical protein